MGETVSKAEGFGALVVATLLYVATFLVEAWAIMLIVGAAHSHGGQVPALSYGASMFLVLAWHVLAGFPHQRD